MNVSRGFTDDLLTPAEEVALARAIEVGLLAGERLDGGEVRPADVDDYRLLVAEGRAAYERLVLCNWRLVTLVALAESRRWALPLSDLVQEGMVGLVEAVVRYDHTSDNRFATYALFWIRNRVSRAVHSRCGMSQTPRSHVRQLQQIRKAQEALAAAGHPADAGTVARRLGADETTVRRRLAVREPASLTALVEDGYEPVATTDLDLDPDTEAWLATRLQALPATERQVIECRYGLADDEPLTVPQTARLLGVSESTVRRLEARALQIMRRRRLAPVA